MGFLVVVQVLVTMLFYPLRIGANGHISLARDKIDLNVTVLGLPVTKLRIKRERGLFSLQITGKQLKSGKKLSLNKLRNIAEQYKIEGLRMRGNILALVGTQDAKTTAMLCAGLSGALQPLISNLKVFTAQPSDTLEIDGRLKIKINVLQILNMIFAGLRGNNG